MMKLGKFDYLLVYCSAGVYDDGVGCEFVEYFVSGHGAFLGRVFD
jgi:hypothetical protein